MFPLPNTVFFPGTVLPLHVFEPRYRHMVRDVVDGSKRMVVTLLKPGWEQDYHGAPAVHGVGTIGAVEDVEPLRDGRYNLRLRGLERVRLDREIQSKPYRIVECTGIPEPAEDEACEQVVAEKLDILATHGYVVSELRERGAGGGGGGDCGSLALDTEVPFASAVNRACGSLPVEPSIRQMLLELDDVRERGRRAAAVLDEVLRALLGARDAPA